MTKAITSLIETLEGAEIGSRELDHLVFLHTAPMEVSSHWSPTDRMTFFTSSLDAGLALADRVLDLRGPIHVSICLAGSAQVVIDGIGACAPTLAQSVARRPALALSAAILRVKKDRGW